MIVVMTIIPAEMVKTNVDNEIAAKKLLTNRDKLIRNPEDPSKK